MALLILVVLLCLYVLLLEFTNGAHDTSNTAATAIYTRSMKPRFAVVWAGLWNTIGVLLGGLTIALTISHIFPVDALKQVDVVEKTAFFLAVLLTIIGWNMYMSHKGYPSSTMHALVGAAIGTSIGYAFEGHIQWSTLPRHALEDVALSLFVSPMISFLIALIIVYVFKHSTSREHFFAEKPGEDRPPLRVRATMALTSTATSFSHGANEAQKGIGLMMAILAVFLPVYFSIEAVPLWTIALIAGTLGLGTIFGYRGILRTVGSKLSKRPMTYGQGLVGELAGTSTILISTLVGLPVSTSHVLASGFTGAISATGGEKSFRKGIVRTIAGAWIVTVPATILLGFTLYQLAIWYVAYAG